MSSKGNRRKQNTERKEAKSVERKDNLNDGAKKTQSENPTEPKKLPQSYMTRMALREAAERAEGPQSMSSIVAKKLKEKGIAIPTDPDEARKVAIAKFKPNREPSDYWHQCQ